MTETNTTHLVLFDMQARKLGTYLVSMNGILISVVRSVADASTFVCSLS
jgi:hypothetical protein